MIPRTFWLICTSVLLSSCLKPPVGAEDTGQLTERNNLLANATFDDGTSLPWTPSFTAPGAGQAKVEDGAYCLEITNKGVNNWDAQFRHRDMVIERGHEYWIQYKMWASAPTKVRPKVGMSGPPYAEYWVEVIDLATEPKTFTGKFMMTENDDPTAEFAFHMGGELAEGATPLTVCIDDVLLADPDFIRPEKEKAAPIPNILVNQVGYFPRMVKVATLKSDATSPLKWELLDQAGSAVASGNTAVQGDDAASGEHLHIIDFSTFSNPGQGYSLRVGEDISHSFAIDTAIYSQMKKDALAYFYHNRSGIDIVMPYAGDEKWTRPAGHQSDSSVPCLPGSGCKYSLDVQGGWYDAGDHGKYVVNGGISVWTLLNQYETGLKFGDSAKKFGDGSMNIPENGNGVPDILDEARYELEFMLKMQVPEGEPLAGMVHHKMHDDAWTPIPTAPHEDKMKRYLHPPSTAATLNMAAVAAQASRIWKDIDAAFSAKALAAAEKAFAAAKQNPKKLASSDADHGGGPYNDDHLDDEFFWAAAELFITTGKEEYKSEVMASPYFKEVPKVLGDDSSNFATGTLNWKETQALGTISLVIASNNLTETDKNNLSQLLLGAADNFLGVMEKQGYRLPLQPSTAGQLPWGSNSFVINNMLVLALAYDFTKDEKYLNGVILGMDYLLGRNPLDQSYVTGYGTRPLLYPHHRFWAQQKSSDYPPAAPGAVSGGPNTSLQDPYVQAAGLPGSAPLKCFIDNIEAWSVNEITINWNAPFAWVVSFLDENAK